MLSLFSQRTRRTNCSQSFSWMAPHRVRAPSSILPAGGQLEPYTTPPPLKNEVGTVKLSRALIAVIVVLGFVGLLIVLTHLFKCIFRPKRLPLPSKQPPALYDEKESKYLPHPYFPGENTGFDQVNNCGGNTSLSRPDRMSSFRTVDSSATQSSGDHLSSMATLHGNVARWPGQSSVESNSDEHISAAQFYTSTTLPVRSVSPSRSRQQLSREGSSASTHNGSTHVSTRSGNTNRTPHSPYSNVQIVLPTPLAPQLQDHMIVNPSVVQNDGRFLGHGDITDRWMGAPTRTTSRRSGSDQNISGDDSCWREASWSFGQQGHCSSDDYVDQPRRPKSQTRSRGRTSSRRPIQRQFPDLGDHTSYPQPPNHQIRPPGPDSQDLYDGRGIFTSTSLRFIPTESP